MAPVAVRLKAELARRFRMYRFYLQRARGINSKLKLAASLAAGTVARGIFNRRAVTFDVEFEDFYVRFRVAQGELTPYLQIEDDVLAGILPNPRSVRGWNVVDCGANIGLFSLYYRRAGHIIAVEPNPECFERLRANFAKNSISGTTLNVAVSSHVGTVHMSINPTNSVGSTTVEAGGREMSATTIDQIASELALDRIHLLKLDLEGHEIEALKGAQECLAAQRVERVYAEFNSVEQLAQLDALLARNSYRRSATAAFNAMYLPVSKALSA